MNGVPGWSVLVLLGLALVLVLMWRHQGRQIQAAAARLTRASASGHLKSVAVTQFRRRIRLTVRNPLDAGWLISPAGGIAAVRSIVPGLTVTADPASSSLVVEL